MKQDKLAQALDEVRGRYIEEAAAAKPKRKRLYWLGALAAMLAVVVLVGSFSGPLALQARAVSIADTPKKTAGYDALTAGLEESKAVLRDFYQTSIAQFLGDSEGNEVYSPISLYFALSMLAEMTDGDSQSQILALLGVEGMDALRDQVAALWQGVSYPRANCDERSIFPANSLWLDDGIRYDQTVMDRLASDYYTSVYQSDFADEATTRALRTWLEQQTKGFLSADGVRLSPRTVFLIASTLYFDSNWSKANEFEKENNTIDIFHSPEGDRQCTFMNGQFSKSYYCGESYGAVELWMEGGSMWLILPDEDKTVDDVLTEGEYLDNLLAPYQWETYKNMRINLSLPKFDVSAFADLTESLKVLGLNDVFYPDTADFSASLPDSNGSVYVNSVTQMNRVLADEDGVRAASFTLIDGNEAGLPLDDTMDFVLDRPFLFVVVDSHNIPLFVGIVRNP